MARLELTLHRSRGTWRTMRLQKRIFAVEMVLFGLFAPVPAYPGRAGLAKYSITGADELRL